jgi:hypothetical protein
VRIDDESRPATYRERLSEPSFVSAGLKLSVEEVQCTTSMCRIAFSSSSAAVESAPVVDRLAAMGPHGGILVTSDAALVGEGKTLAFVASVDDRIPTEPR